MKKAMFFMLVFVGVLFGVVFGYKALMLQGEKQYIRKHSVPIVTISASRAKKATWTKQLHVTASLRTVKGVDVTTELGGMIRDIYFRPGANVKKGDILVVLDIAPDLAKLRQLEAQAEFAKITYQRDRKQFEFGAVSRERLDEDFSNYQSTAAQVTEQKATIEKKIIRAPFSGRLGISAVNPGQYIDPGTKVVTLQTLNPIYVDFFLPQQRLQNIRVGQEIKMTIDRSPGKTFRGDITTINPIVDKDIRNVEVEATLPNPTYELLPGMFSEVELTIGQPKRYIVLPLLAVTFNPYGAIVFVLKETKDKVKGKRVWVAEQQFVTTGESRGNQISVVKGLNVGDMVVTSGQLKLRNGSRVVINNKVQPSDNPNPQVKGEA